MAIKINNITPEMSLWGLRSTPIKMMATQVVNLFTRTNTIIINTDGSITMDEILNLGRQGDHNVTKLEFNLSGLQINYNFNEYLGYCVFRHESGSKYTLSVDLSEEKIGSCSIPEDITWNSGNYEMIFVLQEVQDKTSDVLGNTEIKENFISNVFKGKVEASEYYDFKYATEKNFEYRVTDEDGNNNDDISIYKGDIQVWIPENQTTGITNNVLGNYLDRHVKYFDFSNLGEIWNWYFYFKDSNGVWTKYTADSPKVWVPLEFTSNLNSLNYTMIIVQESDDYRCIYNPMQLKLNSNWLDINDLWRDNIVGNYVVLLDTYGNAILDINGVIIEAEEDNNGRK